ncbi:MAG: aspartate kinase [Chloroflexota bacterium]|nr:aspartate kinase [Chloroflexota bacterium]
MLKFGGTSVGSAEAMLRVAEIIRSHDEPTVVVLSAMSGVTDSLLVAAHAAARGEHGAVRSVVEKIGRRHHEAARAAVTEPHLGPLLAQFEAWLDTLDRVYSALGLLREASPRSLDMVASYGEKLSCALMVGVLCSQGVNAHTLPAEALVRTDDNFGEAMPLMEPTTAAARERLAPLLAERIVPVVPGFTGATSEGVTTTLGRGGSDYTATILGEALNADEVQIYSDTDGVLTADPKVVPVAQPLPHLSYAEARELSFFGAKVIHPRTVLPALDGCFPVRVRNSFNPDFEGTIITADPELAGGSVKSIAYTRNVCTVTVEGSGRPGGPRVAGRALGVLERLSTDAFLTNASSPEQNLSFVLHAERASAVVRELKDEFADEMRRGEVRGINVRDRLGVFAMVGETLGDTSGIGARVWAVLGRIGATVHGFAQAPSGTSFSFVVDGDRLDDAVRALHEEFIP